jgi:hypothetical protein
MLEFKMFALTPITFPVSGAIPHAVGDPRLMEFHSVMFAATPPPALVTGNGVLGVTCVHTPPLQ